MNTGLYLYHTKRLKELKSFLSEYTFYDIAFFLDEYESVNDAKDIDYSDYDKIAIDISDLIQDPVYYRTFVSRYLRALAQIPNLVFCMRAHLLESLEEKFPYISDEMDLNKDFFDPLDTEIEPAKSIDFVRPNIYTYKNSLNSNTDINIKSLGDFIEEWDGFSLKYNLNTIQSTLVENAIDYIDISSLLITLSVRRDLILQFEVLMKRIYRFNETKYCVDESLVEKLNLMFPYLFSDVITMPEDIDNGKNNSEFSAPNIDDIETQIKAICDSLKGHTDFKADFKNCFLKYRFLNSMSERKILSIMLCGSSGIGKTEFAKILSETLFPDEPLIKINFGNYSSEGVLNSLIGSPLGYIGSEEGGELINKIKESKSKVILIDEFEKATPSVYNFFYELLEDGTFTDRHGKLHNLNGYIIVFTSNMSQKRYQEHIPDSLKSRFDMVYYFVDIPIEEKRTYINDSSNRLIEKLNSQFNVKIDASKIQSELYTLLVLNNLRDIKRKIEDIVFAEFFSLYKQNNS